MSELLSKISSYNLYNYLLVGFVYNLLLCHYTQLGYVDESIFNTLIVCYVMGLFIAKLASLFIEPLLRKLHWGNKKFLKWHNKNEYIEAANNDPMIPCILEEANLCRNFIACFMLFFLSILYEEYLSKYVDRKNVDYLFYAFMLVVFVFSYRKKVAQISNRVDKNRSAQ